MNSTMKYLAAMALLSYGQARSATAQIQQAKPTAAHIAAMAAYTAQQGGVGAGAAAATGTPYTLTTAAGTDAMIHLTVGQSMFVRSQSRLNKVYVANPAVLDSFTADPNQVVVTAKAPGTSTLVMWDEAGQSKSYVFSADVSVDALAQAFKQTVPTENIQVLGDESRVILKGTVSTPLIAENAVKLASFYSKDVASSLTVNPSSIKQVRLKVRILEVDRSKLTQFGVNILGSGLNTAGSGTTGGFPGVSAATTVTSVTPPGSGSTGGTTTAVLSDPLNFLLYNSKLNIGVAVKDLENKQVLQILAEPTITAMSGEKANFLAGGEFPFPVVQGGAGGQTSISVQFRTYGVKVEFTPVVNADGTIALKVMPEVSALDYANAVTISGYTIPALATRRAETQVVLKNDQSFAISGLLDRRTTDALGRTPGIASIPILGQLFRSKSYNHSVNELIVIVTPTIVDPLSESTAPQDPKLAVPPLDPQRFDTSLPKGLTKK